MTKTPRRNTPKRAESTRFSARDDRPKTGWIWGRHAVLAALANPARSVVKIRVTRNAATELPAGLDPAICEPRDLDRDLPPGAVHQGFAVEVRELAGQPLQSVLDPTHGTLLVLDQVTDPHNVGAIMRSAAAFGVRAIILQDRKAPPLYGTVCKSAVGAAERLAHIRVTNIADTLAACQKAGRWVIGLSGEGDISLAAALAGPKNLGPGAGLVLVLGSEDKGMRPRVAEHCDQLARIPMNAAVESLNVSNAAAVALYEASKWHPALRDNA